MRFSVRDVILLTAVVAVWAVMIQSFVNLRRKQASLAVLQANLEMKRNEVESYRLYTPKDKLIALRDQAAEYNAALQTALLGFEKIREKYSKLVPVTGKMAILKAPTITDDIDFRIWVPKEYPIFLRGIIRSESLEREKYDEAEWQSLTDFESVGPFEFQLPTGEQSLVISYSKIAPHKIQVWHRDKLLHEVLMPTGYFLTGYSHTAAGDQYDYKPKQFPLTLIKLFISQTAPQPRYEFLLWLSTKPELEQAIDFDHPEAPAKSDSVTPGVP